MFLALTSLSVSVLGVILNADKQIVESWRQSDESSLASLEFMRLPVWMSTPSMLASNHGDTTELLSRSTNTSGIRDIKYITGDNLILGYYGELIVCLTAAHGPLLEVECLGLIVSDHLPIPEILVHPILCGPDYRGDLAMVDYKGDLAMVDYKGDLAW